MNIDSSDCDRCGTRHLVGNPCAVPESPPAKPKRRTATLADLESARAEAASATARVLELEARVAKLEAALRDCADATVKEYGPVPAIVRKALGIGRVR